MSLLTGAEPAIYWHAQGMQDVPADARWMDDPLAARLARMRYTKRRDEARLGRWTAKLSIALAAGLHSDPAALKAVVVANAADGAPEAYLDTAPLQAVIAMTDRADWAVCAIMVGGARVGCDLELVEPRSNEFVADYLTPAEQRCVAASGDIALHANLIWSAKESALKVLRTGLRRDTRSVEVTLEGAGDGAGATSWSPLSVRSAEGRVFPGWWMRSGQFILTVAAEVAAPPPISLLGGQPLSLAEPGHRWMSSPIST